MVHSLEIVVKSRDHDISYPENLEVEKEILPVHNTTHSPRERGLSLTPTPSQEVYIKILKNILDIDDI